MAVASSPAGPFVNAAPIQAAAASVISDTVALWVDEQPNGSQKAYLRYNTRDTPLRHVVEELNPSWLKVTGRSSVIFEKQSFPWYDGGGMFRVGDAVYAMLGFDCCFCQWGQDSLVFVAPTPLGPWQPQPKTQHTLAGLQLGAGVQPPANWTNEINPCADGQNPPFDVANSTINPCSQRDVQGTNFTVPAQQFSVACLTDAKGRPLPLYFGENFRSSQDGLKSHDLQTWLPLQTDQHGRLRTMVWQDSFVVDV